MPTFRIDGRKTTRAKAAAHWAVYDNEGRTPEDPKGSFDYFDTACEQSGTGYVARDHVEESGVTIRHKGEEDAS